MGQPESFKPDEEEAQIRRVFSCLDAPMTNGVTPAYRKPHSRLNSLAARSPCGRTE
jgi:hypothetical protein